MTMMTPAQIYEAWAPAGAPWSPWAKPVLFAHLLGVRESDADLLWREACATLTTPPPDLGWLPPADGTTALVIDLPGAEGVRVGVHLAARGYRPVPLYNAVPWPGVVPVPESRVTVGMGAVVDLVRAAGPRLDALGLSWSAPPAFLLDSRRRLGDQAPRPGIFDNRQTRRGGGGAGRASPAGHARGGGTAAGAGR